MSREFTLDNRKFPKLKFRDFSAVRFAGRSDPNGKSEHMVQLTLKPDGFRNTGNADFDFVCVSKQEAKELAKFLNEWVKGREPEGW